MTFPPFPPFPAYGAVYGGGGGRGRGNFVPLILFQLFFTYKYLGGHMGRGGRGDGYGGWGWGGWGGAEGAQWQHPGGQVGADDERHCADGIWWITTTPRL